MGLLGWFFKFIQHKSYSINLKCAYCMIMSVVFVIGFTLAGATDGRYIACLSFGYTCFRVWGEHKPAKEIAECWFYLQPFLFGTIGAALLFS